jgi:hypothetical protein
VMEEVEARLDILLPSGRPAQSHLREICTHIATLDTGDQSLPAHARERSQLRSMLCNTGVV